MTAPLQDLAFRRRMDMHYESWCALSEDELAKRDIAEINLAAAFGLPPSGLLDVKGLCRQVDDWTALVEHANSRMRSRRTRSEYLRYTDSEFLILTMITVLQRTLKAGYNRAFSDGEYDATDSRNLFIHGLLSGFGGTCVSMPVLYIAVGRRLGYPLKLVHAKEHSFCRWDENGGERFNIEATALGFDSPPDEYYKNWPKPVSARAVREGWVLRNQAPREELAGFLAQRGHCLFDHLEPALAAEAYCHAHRIAPEEPSHYNHWGLAVLMHRIVEELKQLPETMPLSQVRLTLSLDKYEKRILPTVLQHFNRIRANAKAKRDASPKERVFNDLARSSQLTNH